jgi:hypothetical protein
MSSFKAILKLSSRKSGVLGEFEVLRCQINTGRPYDNDGLPTGRIRAFIIEVDIVISENEVLIGSVFDANDLVKGSIEFKKIDADSKFRTIKFDKSWIVEYDERFEPSSQSPMVCKLNISGGDVEVDGVNHVRSWASKLG